MPFETPEKAKPASPDRKLGDEWADWDGSPQSRSTQAPAGMFLILSGFALVLFNLLLLGVVWLVAPRFAEWNMPFLSKGFAWAGSGFFWLLFICLLLAYAGMGSLKRAVKVLGGVRWLIGPVVILGRFFGFSRDRIGHAFVLVHNRIEVLPPPLADAGKLLILAPRCLSRESVQGLRALKEQYGFEQVVAFGGTEARKAIGQVRPQGIIAVACERDLLVGIRDVRGRIPVLGFSNDRPEGPCKNTQVDLQAIEAAVLRFLGRKMDVEVHI